MANGAFKFKDNSGNVVSFISGSGPNISFSGGTLDLSGMTGLTLGNLTLSGTTQNAQTASSAPSYLLTSSFNTYSSSLATTGSNLFKGNQTISGSIIPAVDNAYDLGSVTHQFRDLYLSSASLYIDGTKVLGSTAQELQITTDTGQSFKILEAGSDTITLQSADGNITLTSSGGGDVIMDPTNGIIALKGTTTVYSGHKIVSSDGNSIQFGNGIAVTGSIVSTVTPLVSGSSQISYTGLSNIPSGIISSSTQLPSGIVSSSLQVTGYGFSTTGSNVFVGSQVITGSLYITTDLVVQGCSSLQNITASAVSIGTNTVMLNTSTPALRFAGISVQDSGSNVGVTGSIYWDGLCNRWIYSNPSNIGYSGGMLLSGPRTATLGSESPLTCNYIAKSGGGDHLYDSCIIDDGTTVCINATLKANGQVCSLMGNFSCVGIGTTSPAERLSVAGAIMSTCGITGHGANRTTISQEGGNGAFWQSYGADASTIGTFTLRQASSDFSITRSPLVISSTGAATFSCSVSANSLNINTSTVFAKANISDALTATSIGTNYNPGILNIQNSNTTNGNLSLIGFQDANAFINLAAVGAINDIHSASPNSVVGSLGFYTKASGGAYITEKMRINGDGNVGIGTNTPSSTYGRLTVAGTGISIADDGNAKLQIGRFSSTACNAYIKMGTNACSLRFTNNTDLIDILTIDKGGNVGIGCVSPGAQLVVYGACNGDTTLHVQNGSVSGKITFSNNTANTIYGGGWYGYMGYNSATHHYFAQNVGIGQSNPTFGLEVFSSSQAAVTSNNTFGANFNIIFNRDNTGGTRNCFNLLADQNSAYIRTLNDFPINFVTNGQNRLLLSNTGNACFACTVSAPHFSTTGANASVRGGEGAFFRGSNVTQIGNNVTFDAFRFLNPTGGIGGAASSMSGTLFMSFSDTVTGGNQVSYQYLIFTTGNGVTPGPYCFALLYCGPVRGTNPISSITLVNDGEGGAVKVRATTAASGVGGASAYISFVGTAV